MAARDLDFEEVSVLRERSEALKDGYTSYLQSHPELSQLLGDLVSSCLVHRPDDVFEHAASHFGGKRADAAAGMMKGLRAFKAALEKEAAAEGFDLPVLLKHVFYTYDADHNGTLEPDEWLTFLAEVGEGHGLSYEQAETDAIHEFICGEPDGHMSSGCLVHVMQWLDTEDGAYAPLVEEADDGAAAAGAVSGGSRPGAETPDAAASSAPRIIIAGAPASGKGTQCERIVEKYGIKHISTGDLLRAAVVAETELGQKAKGHMEKGELVPDELLIPLVADGLSATEEGWLLDGFPRTQPQAQALKDSGVVPDVLLVLDVPDEELTGRCVDRRLDPISGKIYHLKNNPPEDEEVAARLIQRSDDTAEKIQTRLRLYHENKDAVCAVFADQVRRVDGNRPAETVTAAIEKIVDTGADAEMEASAARIQASFRGQQTRKQMNRAPVADAAPFGVLLVGAPASGKGAQSGKIAKEYGLKRLSTGDLVRAAINAGTELGKQAKALMDEQSTVSDEILVQLAVDAIKSSTSGWLLDGFPRTQEQASAIKDAGASPTAVLLIDVPDDVLVGKCVNRRIDPDSGTIYDATDLPEGVDASTLVQRADDQEDRVRARLDTFATERDAVCGVFSDIVHTVDGNQAEEDVFAEASQVIASVQ